jgi:16S rRNA (cytosine967-C5)-methyltransferase
LKCEAASGDRLQRRSSCFSLHNSSFIIHNSFVPISPARQAAYRILLRIESGHDFAVDLLHRPQVSRMREADRRLATEIVMGVLRWRGELDFRIEELSGKRLNYFDAEIAAILRLSFYQIQFLTRIPKSAIVHEAVELARISGKSSAAGLVNAVLRKCEPTVRGAPDEGREEEPGEPRPEMVLAAVRSLPAWLAERWSRNFGTAAMERLAWASASVPRTTLRIVGGAGTREEVQRQLLEDGVVTRPGRYGTGALVVESGGAPSLTIVRDGGAIIQDEASQLVAALVAPKRGDRVLDLCAAPGIKAGQIATALGAGHLLACDLSSRRLATMKQLLPQQLSGDLHLNLLRLDATEKLPFGLGFDRILVDAPCSGTGTLARNPEIKWRLRPEDLGGFAERQVQMVRSALGALNPCGRLVYSTCSLEPEENERVAEAAVESNPGTRLLSANEISKEFPALSTLFDPHGYFRTRPDLHDMDGFFAAVIEKA